MSNQLRISFTDHLGYKIQECPRCQSKFYGHQEKALARNSDPSTSHEAADSLDSTTLDTHRRMILDCLRESPRGLTGDAIEARLGWPNCRATRRLPELFRMGLVRPEGRAKTRSNRWARLWHLTN